MYDVVVIVVRVVIEMCWFACVMVCVVACDDDNVAFVIVMWCVIVDDYTGWIGVGCSGVVVNHAGVEVDHVAAC